MRLFFAPKASANRKRKLRSSGVEFNGETNLKNLFFQCEYNKLFSPVAVGYNCCLILLHFINSINANYGSFFSKLNLFANNTRIRILHFNIDLTCHAKFQWTVLFLNHRQSFRKLKKKKKQDKRGGRYKSVDLRCKTPPKKDQEEKTTKMAAAKGIGVDAGIAATAALSGWMFKKKNLHRALKVFSSGYRQGGGGAMWSKLRSLQPALACHTERDECDWSNSM